MLVKTMFDSITHTLIRILNFMKKVINLILDWMIVLKVEDEYIKKTIAHERERIAIRRAKLRTIEMKRLTSAEQEIMRAERIGQRILEDADTCMAIYGYHQIIRDDLNNQYFNCLGERPYGWGSRCQRCGVMVERNAFGHHKLCDNDYYEPHKIGYYCNCKHCKNFVGDASPHVIADPPEDWVKSAFWHCGKIYPRNAI